MRGGGGGGMRGRQARRGIHQKGGTTRRGGRRCVEGSECTGEWATHSQTQSQTQTQTQAQRRRLGVWGGCTGRRGASAAVLSGSNSASATDGAAAPAAGAAAAAAAAAESAVGTAKAAAKPEAAPCSMPSRAAYAAPVGETRTNPIKSDLMASRAVAMLATFIFCHFTLCEAARGNLAAARDFGTIRVLSSSSQSTSSVSPSSSRSPLPHEAPASSTPGVSSRLYPFSVSKNSSTTSSSSSPSSPSSSSPSSFSSSSSSPGLGPALATSGSPSPHQSTTPVPPSPSLSRSPSPFPSPSPYPSPHSDAPPAHPSISPPASNSSSGGSSNSSSDGDGGGGGSSSGGFCLALVRPRGSILEIGWFDVAISLPVVVFIMFLATRVKQSLRRLRQTGSQVMAAYYGLLWAVCVANLVRCVIEVTKRPDVGDAWNLGWLASRCAMVFLESSVVVFLFQGYSLSGFEALVRTAIASGAIAAVDTTIKATLVFRYHVPLFVPTSGDVGEWPKWLFWTVHHSLFAAVYAFILALPYTKYRDRLPARPSFYRYVSALLAIDLVSVVGSLTLLEGSEVGYCVHGFSGYLHSVLFPPLLYFTFLSDFFREDDTVVEEAYYSEMKEAGYFEDDWE